MHELLAMLFLVLYRDRTKHHRSPLTPHEHAIRWAEGEEVDERAAPDSFLYTEHDTYTLFAALMGNSDSPGVRTTPVPIHLASRTPPEKPQTL
jgi:hypothetical protein